MLNAVLFPLIHSRFQRADTDTGSPQIGSFVNFQHRIQLVVFLRYFFHLVGSNRVQPTAKGIELHQFHVIGSSHKLGRLIKS